MIFNINKKSTLPKLRLELIQDGRNDYRNFYEKIQNANIYFCMYDSNNGKTVIGRKLATLELKEPTHCAGEEYYIVYQLTERETSISGKYIGKFIIEFLDGTGTLIAPISDTLYINILDQGIKI